MNYANTPALLSDALERAYTQAVMDSSETISFKGMFKGVARIAKRIGRGLERVMEAQAEARARSASYSRAEW